MVSENNKNNNVKYDSSIIVNYALRGEVKELHTSFRFAGESGSVMISYIFEKGEETMTNIPALT